MMIAVRSAFHKGSKYYPPFVSDIFLYKFVATRTVKFAK